MPHFKSDWFLQDTAKSAETPPEGGKGIHLVAVLREKVGRPAVSVGHFVRHRITFLRHKARLFSDVGLVVFAYNAPRHHYMLKTTMAVLSPWSHAYPSCLQKGVACLLNGEVKFWAVIAEEADLHALDGALAPTQQTCESLLLPSMLFNPSLMPNTEVTDVQVPETVVSAAQRTGSTARTSAAFVKVHICRATSFCKQRARKEYLQAFACLLAGAVITSILARYNWIRAMDTLSNAS